MIIITHRYKSQRNLQNFMRFETNRAEKNVFSGPPTPKIQYQPPTHPVIRTALWAFPSFRNSWSRCKSPRRAASWRETWADYTSSLRL